MGAPEIHITQIKHVQNRSYTDYTTGKLEKLHNAQPFFSSANLVHPLLLPFVTKGSKRGPTRPVLEKKRICGVHEASCDMREAPAPREARVWPQIAQYTSQRTPGRQAVENMLPGRNPDECPRQCRLDWSWTHGGPNLYIFLQRRVKRASQAKRASARRARRNYRLDHAYIKRDQHYHT